MSLKIPLRIIISDASGTVLEDDGEPNEEDTQALPNTAQSDTDELGVKWTTVRAALLPVVTKFISSRHEKAPSMAAVWKIAEESATADDYVTALKAAAKVKFFLGKTNGIPKGIVVKRAFLIDRWTRITADINASLKSLIDAIPATVQWEDPIDLQNLVGGKLTEKTSSMQAAILDGFDADVKSGDGTYSETRQAISEQRNSLATDSLIVALRDNTLSDGSKFVTLVEQGLVEIDTALGA